jgi:membrane-bound hydrogenase subunit mbhJ
MFASRARQKSLSVCHLHMGGPNGDALEWRALLAPRYEAKLKSMGVSFVTSVEDADVVAVTGLLTRGNLDAVLAELSGMPSPSVLVAAGDCAINGGAWAKLEMPGLEPYPLSHYADVHLTVPGSPPSPQALLEALAAAAHILTQPGERLSGWQDC